MSVPIPTEIVARTSSERAVSPVVGVALLALVTVTAAGALAAGVSSVEAPSPAPTTALDLSVNAATDELAFVHRGGDALPVEALTIRIRVDGEPLAHQPPVPFFAARGFVSGPTGPFNSATEGRWEAGEVATLRVAGTNAPDIDPGSTVTVRIYADGLRVAELSVVA